jgi:signal transduction histidine kinase
MQSFQAVRHGCVCGPRCPCSSASVASVLVIYVLIAVTFELELSQAGLLKAPSDPVTILTSAWSVHRTSLLLAIGVWVAGALAARRVNDRIGRAFEQAKQIYKAQNEFLSIVSHEFRTPLTGIQGFSELIRDEELPANLIHEYAGDINADAHRLSRMIGDMLDAQRLEHGRLQIERAPVDLNQLVRDVVRQQSVVAKNHEIVTSFDRAVLIVDGDADRLIQVVTNLVANAVKYATPGKITVSTELVQDEAAVRVADEGPGIPRESVDRIFERYYRVPTRDIGLITGTGLGLPIVRGLVELHGGRVWCESSPTTGSVFHVLLPVSAPRRAS